MGGNFKFQVQDSFLECFFLEIGRFEKRISLSEKKAPLKVKIFLDFFFQSQIGLVSIPPNVFTQFFLQLNSTQMGIIYIFSIWVWKIGLDEISKYLSGTKLLKLVNFHNFISKKKKNPLDVKFSPFYEIGYFISPFAWTFIFWSGPTSWVCSS